MKTAKPSWVEKDEEVEEDERDEEVEEDERDEEVEKDERDVGRVSDPAYSSHVFAQCSCGPRAATRRRGDAESFMKTVIYLYTVSIITENPMENIRYLMKTEI